MVNTVFNIFMINIDIITENYSAFDQSDSTLFGVIFICGGLVGCFVSGYVLGKKPKFKMIAIGSAVMHFVSYTAFVVTLEFYQSRVVTSI